MDSADNIDDPMDSREMFSLFYTPEDFASFSVGGESPLQRPVSTEAAMVFHPSIVAKFYPLFSLVTSIWTPPIRFLTGSRRSPVPTLPMALLRHCLIGGVWTRLHGARLCR